MQWTATLKDPAAASWRVEVGEHRFDLVVEAGPDRLRRLERAVLTRLGLPPRADAPVLPCRVERRTWSSGGLFELEEHTAFRVVDTRTGEALWEFDGGMSTGSYDGAGWAMDGGGHGGCDEVVVGVAGILASEGPEVKSHVPPRRSSAP